MVQTGSKQPLQQSSIWLLELVLCGAPCYPFEQPIPTLVETNAGGPFANFRLLLWPDICLAMKAILRVMICLCYHALMS